MDRESQVRWVDSPDNGLVVGPGGITEREHAGHAAVDREVGPNEDEFCPWCKETRAQRFERRLRKFLA